MPMLAARLETQGFDGIDGGGTARWIQRRKDGDGAQNSQSHRSCLPCGQQSGEEVWHGQQIDQRTKAESDAASLCRR